MGLGFGLRAMGPAPPPRSTLILGFDPKTLTKKQAEPEVIEESAENIQSGFSLGD